MLEKTELQSVVAQLKLTVAQVEIAYELLQLAALDESSEEVSMSSHIHTHEHTPDMRSYVTCYVPLTVRGYYSCSLLRSVHETSAWIPSDTVHAPQ
jgi:hypothetical protein